MLHFRNGTMHRPCLVNKMYSPTTTGAPAVRLGHPVDVLNGNPILAIRAGEFNLGVEKLFDQDNLSQSASGPSKQREAKTGLTRNAVLSGVMQGAGHRLPQYASAGHGMLRAISV